MALWRTCIVKDKHTHRICNTLCFFTATFVAQTRPNSTFYINCPPCFFFFVLSSAIKIWDFYYTLFYSTVTCNIIDLQCPRSSLSSHLTSNFCITLKYKRLYTLTIRFNPLTPNDPYRCRTAPLTSKRCILYIYSTNIGTEYLKHGIYSPFFSLQNAVRFIILTYLVPVLFTFYIQDVLKLKKK